MSRYVEEVSKWCYRGVWGGITRWFKVPELPPTLPVERDEVVTSFRPSLEFLKYMKFFFWIGLTIIDVGLTLGWIGIFVAAPWVGLMITPLALAIIILPDVVAYIAIHLRYDTTWYVLTDRSLRIRRGIWAIHETTITFENIQNVAIHQGPIERWFGIARIVVETAGGGGGAGEPGKAMGAHVGLIEGIDNAPEIRDLIRSRIRQSKSAGLGDDTTDLDTNNSSKTKPFQNSGSGFSPQHLQILQEIRSDLLAASSLGSAKH